MGGYKGFTAIPEAVRTAKRSYTYDPKCEELARYFLPDDAPAYRIALLAQIIQDEVESELSAFERHNEDMKAQREHDKYMARSRAREEQ